MRSDLPRCVKYLHEADQLLWLLTGYLIDNVFHLMQEYTEIFNSTTFDNAAPNTHAFVALHKDSVELCLYLWKSINAFLLLQ